MIARRARRGRVFGWPMALAVVSLTGLIVGLLGDGWYDILAGLTMSIPIAIMAWALMKARHGKWDR